MYQEQHASNAPSSWNDFNDAEAQQSGFDLIPKGTQAVVRMTIKLGGYDEPDRGWTSGYATASHETGAVFLSCEFVVLHGQFVKRKIWSNVGLHSNKGPTWGQMGRSFIKAVLNSSRNIHRMTTHPRRRMRDKSGALQISMAWSSPHASVLKKTARVSCATSSAW